MDRPHYDFVSSGWDELGMIVDVIALGFACAAVAFGTMFVALAPFYLVYLAHQGLKDKRKGKD